MIKKQTYKLLLPAIILTLFACKPTTLSEQELKQYVLDPENGLYKDAKEGLHDIKLTYRPSELLVAQELKTKDSISEEEIQQIRENYGAYAYFLLSLSYQGNEFINKGLSDPNQYGQMIEQLAFNMKDQAKMITSEQDTITAIDAIFSRMYGMTKSNTIMITFPGEEIYNSKNFQFILKGKELGIRNKKFEFETRDINRVKSRKLQVESIEGLKIKK